MEEEVEEATELLILEEYESEFRWPCCASCDGWRCDLHGAEGMQRVTFQIVYGNDGLRIRIVGENAEKVREVLGL